ncbi:Delta(24)-sterol C-methyltransferase [Entomortierella chlamydospora]|uniref:Sterol 24-C-methyltransferase n=1 Tax=Entomortierella chlamydospora TaxID=101097 RepID=A0A9P6MYD6_9FUNG|nr:Delta(24)-sterol C-methyltransferase [Entomortierella chlamydospora]KAG0017185.1 Delta(24)-sterol C-methyltransferase [Entomortierella chlamydospora]
MAPTATSTALITKRNQEDLTRSKVLHGQSFNPENHQSSFVNRLSQKDNEYQPVVVKDYLGNWKEVVPEKETEEAKAERASSYSKVANAYYDLVTDFYEYGWGNSFHFCRFRPHEPFEQAIARHEHYMAANMHIRPDQKVLDIGCGVGGPAREIAHFTGAHVTGLNNNDYQISRAKRHSAAAGLADRTDFIKGDFMNMPFDDNHFDACYAIEATVHASTLEGAYREVYRILKPGGIFGNYEWVLTDKFDPTNVEHIRLVRGIEVGNGVARLVTAKECVQALKNAGFEVQTYQDISDASITGDKIPWYTPLEGDITKATSLWDLITFLRTTTPGRAFTTYMLKGLEAVHLVAPGSARVSGILQTAADSLAESARIGIFTPMFFFVARKPEA